MKNLSKALKIFEDEVGELMEEPILPPRKAKKNTKKWCKGRTGVTHIWSEWSRMFPTLQFSRMKERKCLSCGKKDVDYIKKEEEI